MNGATSVFNTHGPGFFRGIWRLLSASLRQLERPKGELFVHRLAARTRFKEKNVDNSNDLMVLQERIELSTSPLPRAKLFS
jgi:hypothetical protein